MTDTFSDVAEAARGIIRAFKRHHMKPPTAILLENKEDAFRIMASAQDFNLTPVVLSPRPNVHEFDGKPWGLIEICGIKFYYPLQQIPLEGGGFYYG